MPMIATSTNVEADWASLLASLKSFAGANGWTVNGDIIYHTSEPVAAKVTTSGNELRAVIGDGHSAGALTGIAPNTTAGGLPGVEPYVRIKGSSNGGSDLVFPITRWFYAHSDPPLILCVVKYNVLWYQYLCWGRLVRYGAYTGGHFCAASWGYPGGAFENSSTYDVAGGLNGGGAGPMFGLRRNPGTFSPAQTGGALLRCNIGADKDWFTDDQNVAQDNWRTAKVQWNGNAATGNEPCTNRPLPERMVKSWNGQLTLLPIDPRCQRADGFWSLVGHVPGVRLARLDNHDPEDEVTIGGEVWKLFPWYRRGPSLYSRYYGMAVRMP